jgi:membrane protease YdiL (CAAX protease family)
MLSVLFYCSFSALIVGSIPLWWTATNRKRLGGQFLELRKRDGSPFGFIDVAVMFLFWFLGQIVSIGVAFWLFDLDSNAVTELAGAKKAWFTVLVNVGQLAAMLAAVAFLFFRYKKLSTLGWQPENLRRDLILAGFAFAMVVPSILALQWLLTLFLDYRHSTLEMLANNADALTVIASWFGAVLVAPVCEEIFFRGVLQSWLQRLRPGVFAKSDYILIGGWDPSDADEEPVSPQAPADTNLAGPHDDGNPYSAPRASGANGLVVDSLSTGKSWTSSSYWPIVITAAMFSLAHAGQGPAPIPLFFFGLALGYVYQKTGSIVPCILLHMMLNGFSMFWFTLQVLVGGPGGG